MANSGLSVLVADTAIGDLYMTADVANSVVCWLVIAAEAVLGGAAVTVVQCGGRQDADPPHPRSGSHRPGYAHLQR